MKTNNPHFALVSWIAIFLGVLITTLFSVEIITLQINFRFNNRVYSISSVGGSAAEAPDTRARDIPAQACPNGAPG